MAGWKPIYPEERKAGHTGLCGNYGSKAKAESHEEPELV